MREKIMSKKPIVIGITGGSGSGKTSVSRKIIEAFPALSVVLIEQDAYYKDQSHLTFEERLKTNYDHPFAFDGDLLVADVKRLMMRQAIDKPVYDYVEHTRSSEVIRVEPKDVIIIEGLFVLDDVRLRELMDIKIYVDTDDDLRIIRRIVRDIKERGRSLDSVITQYLEAVKPMYHQFIEPTKRLADIIIPEGSSNTVGIDLICTKVATILQD